MIWFLSVAIVLSPELQKVRIFLSIYENYGPSTLLWGIAVRAPVVHFLAVDVVAKVSAEHGVSLALVQADPEV